MSDSLGDALRQVTALDPALGARVTAGVERLATAAEAMAWARERLPALVAAASTYERLELLVSEARGLTGAPSVWALEWSGDIRGGRCSLRAVAGAGPDGAVVADLGPEGLSRSVLGQAAREGAPVWSDDAARDARYASARSVRALSLRSVGCVPLGRNGALYLLDPDQPGRFGPADRARLVALCSLVSPFVDAPPARPVPTPTIPGLVGDTPAMRTLFAAIRAFAPMPWPALVLGETGTGKEAVAEALHRLSPRADAPFVPVNCGAIPEELAESTLFGHEKGAFTGADRRREGLVERVGRGTLFLDEVGELSPRAQVKLLRLLQEGTFERVGGEHPLRFEGRVVAATHRPVDDPGRRDTFREDLYHRLAACVLTVPPVRDRRADIPLLAEHLLRRSLAELPGTPAVRLGPAAVAWLQEQAWPGNVRELSNALRRALALALARGADEIGREDLGAPPSRPREEVLAGGLEEATDAFQRARVEEALAAVGGNKSRAAERLGVSRQWLHKLLARWGVE